MKKIWLIGFIMLLVLSGCKKESTTKNEYDVKTVCKYSKTEDYVITDTFYSKDDVVLTNETVYYYDFTEEVNDGTYTLEFLDEEFEATKVAYNAVEGLSHDYLREGMIITEEIVYDLKKISFDVLVDLEYLTSSNIDFISIEQTIDNLEGVGYTCEVVQ